MAGLSIASRIDRSALARIADALVVGVAVSLPWSTSATGVLVVLWLLALVPTLEWGGVRRELVTLPGGLPVLLVLLGAVGTLWADVTWIERWKGLESFFKLLAIPLLFAQFRHSDCAKWVFGGYAVACIAVLVLSYVLVLWPHPILLFSRDAGVPVKNAASQSGEFATCIFGLVYLAYESAVRRQWRWLIANTTVILAMLANILFVATGRTALVVILVLLALFVVRKLHWRGAFLFLAGAAVILVAAWESSSYFRTRTEQVWTDIQKYEATVALNSSGERIEFAKKSIEFIRAAPVIGHGTGTIHALFTQASIGRTGAAGSDTTNPHNQTFAVAIQLGFVGALVLWAMWLAHFLLFRGNSLVEWIGLVIVVQNVVGSLFNSHLFDFMQGWVYVIGVGVAGGIALKNGQWNGQPALRHD